MALTPVQMSNDKRSPRAPLRAGVGLNTAKLIRLEGAGSALRKLSGAQRANA
jgi:hypothetical protein